MTEVFLQTSGQQTPDQFSLIQFYEADFLSQNPEFRNNPEDFPTHIFLLWPEINE